MQPECRAPNSGSGNEDEARWDFAIAREIAIQQGAVIFERRASASLAELCNGPTTG
jgi:hypothetical protein